MFPKVWETPFLLGAQSSDEFMCATTLLVFPTCIGVLILDVM